MPVCVACRFFHICEDGNIRTFSPSISFVLSPAELLRHNLRFRIDGIKAAVDSDHRGSRYSSVSFIVKGRLGEVLNCCAH